MTEGGLVVIYACMGKRNRKHKSNVAATSPERRSWYGFTHVLLVNAIGWAVLLLIPFVVGKSFAGHGADIYPFYGVLGLCFTVGSVLDYSLDRI